MYAYVRRYRSRETGLAFACKRIASEGLAFAGLLSVIEVNFDYMDIIFHLNEFVKRFLKNYLT